MPRCNPVVDPPGGPRWRVVAALALPLLLTLPACTRSSSSSVSPPPSGTVSGGVAVGQQAPEIAGVDLDGVEFKLSDYRGKVVLLDFWGNW